MWAVCVRVCVCVCARWISFISKLTSKVCNSLYELHIVAVCGSVDAVVVDTLPVFVTEKFWYEKMNVHNCNKFDLTQISLFIFCLFFFSFDQK